MSTMPKQKPGKSRQDYGTPAELIAAVVARFGTLTADLAATAENAVAPEHLGPETDSLKVEWASEWPTGQLWLNPPFADIAPWAKKCAVEQAKRPVGSRIFLLVPASIGANWFAEHVHKQALVLALSPRLTFAGETQSYPKDCCICAYGCLPGFDIWRWKR